MFGSFLAKSQMLSAVLFQPLFQLHSVVLKQEAIDPNPVTEKAVRIAVAGGAGDLLISHVRLSRCEPLLRQDFNQPGM